MSEAGFAGFPSEGLAFLRELAEHNEKPWFEANRPRYEAHVLAPLRALVAALASRCATEGVPLTAEPLKAVFRIHRDVRFSRDKRPYKTNAAAVLTPDGTKATPGVLYIHIAPAGSFVAGGFHQPEPAQLAALRTAIAGKPKPFLAALAALHAAGLDLSREDPLARLPRGFEAMAGSPVAEVLRLRHLIVSRPLAAAALGQPALVETVLDFARTCLPLLRFGWTALA